MASMLEHGASARIAGSEPLVIPSTNTRLRSGQGRRRQQWMQLSKFKMKHRDSLREVYGPVEFVSTLFFELCTETHIKGNKCRHVALWCAILGEEKI